MLRSAKSISLLKSVEKGPDGCWKLKEVEHELGEHNVDIAGKRRKLDLSF
jgi:hypothetical protein